MASSSVLSSSSSSSACSSPPCLPQLHAEWNVRFKPESIERLPAMISENLLSLSADSPDAAHLPHKDVLTLSTLKKFLLSTDPRALPLLPPLPDNHLHQKAGPAAGGGGGEQILSFPLFVMLVSSRDITLPTRESEEFFDEERQEASSYVYSGNNKRRLLWFKVTAGPGCTYTAIEHRYCKQLDNIPLIPGLKFLISPNTRVMNNLLLLTPQNLSVLGGNVRNLSSAYRLQEQVFQHRQQHSQLHTRQERRGGRGSKEGGEDEPTSAGGAEGDAGPPKFIPFSYTAVQKAREEGQDVVRQALQEQREKETLLNASSAAPSSSDTKKLREDERELAKKKIQELKEEKEKEREREQRNNVSRINGEGGDPGHDQAGGAGSTAGTERTQKKKEDVLQALGMPLASSGVRGGGGGVDGRTRMTRGRGGGIESASSRGGGERGRGGRGGRRGRRRGGGEEYDEDESVYLKDSRQPVSYNLLDLICSKDQHHKRGAGEGKGQEERLLGQEKESPFPSHAEGGSGEGISTSSRRGGRGRGSGEAEKRSQADSSGTSAYYYYYDDANAFGYAHVQGGGGGVSGLPFPQMQRKGGGEQGRGGLDTFASPQPAASPYYCPPTSYASPGPPYPLPGVYSSSYPPYPGGSEGGGRKRERRGGCWGC